MYALCPLFQLLLLRHVSKILTLFHFPELHSKQLSVTRGDHSESKMAICRGFSHEVLQRIWVCCVRMYEAWELIHVKQGERLHRLWPNATVKVFLRHVCMLLCESFPNVSSSGTWWLSNEVGFRLPWDPGLSSSNDVIRLMSAVYRIWVRCFKTCVQSSGVGERRYTKPLPSWETTFPPNGLPIQDCNPSHIKLSLLQPILCACEILAISTSSDCNGLKCRHWERKCTCWRKNKVSFYSKHLEASVQASSSSDWNQQVITSYAHHLRISGYCMHLGALRLPCQWSLPAFWSFRSGN